MAQLTQREHLDHAILSQQRFQMRTHIEPFASYKPVAGKQERDSPSLALRADPISSAAHLAGVAETPLPPSWPLMPLPGTGNIYVMFLSPRFVQSVPGPLWYSRSTIFSLSFSAIV